eukprot:TRINITY_DN2980_c0_g1_i1.p1 TRINITY_DN2980_c0_g1~~TRINITY_DN2980_c0_g1_i1.p1  ORF type:complete len:290 (-),score=68.24 TRINITY_DN2980_c0_g1_i1:47-916(-)
MSNEDRRPKDFPIQQQDVHPGKEWKMDPEPFCDNPSYKGSDKLKDKVAIITGGDSGIGRSVAIHFAREGANVTIVYLKNHDDANKTKEYIEKEGRECLAIASDVSTKKGCEDVAQQTFSKFGKVDILVNHAGCQYFTDKFEDITEEELEKVFRTNVFSMVFMTQAALPHMKKGSSIINTTSVVAHKGSKNLIAYASSKGATRSLMHSMALNLADRGIRVNGVAPGPIWTPFIPSSFPVEKLETFGKDTLLERAGQPEEVAPAYVYLASESASYITGETIHVNGGKSFSM